MNRRHPLRNLRTVKKPTGIFPLAISRKLLGSLGRVTAISFFLLSAVAWTQSAESVSAQTIIERAHEAAGGDAWLRAKTLMLEGTAEFTRDGQYNQSTHVDDYKMWRVFPQRSTDAHAANGKVRFDARSGSKLVFQISFDGSSSYNQQGRIDDEAATRRWKSNFGFGIIRFALQPGFTLTRMADDSIEGHPSYFVLVTDPESRNTLFAIDKFTYAVRFVGFDTPQGFHHRIYDDLYRNNGQSFTQPGHVRLYYDGVKTADIHWTRYVVDQAIPDATFVLESSD